MNYSNLSSTFGWIFGSRLSFVSRFIWLIYYRCFFVAFRFASACRRFFYYSSRGPP